MTKYGKYKSDRLWSINQWNRLWKMELMRWNMVDEMNDVDYGRWNEWDTIWYVNKKKWSDGKMVAT